MKILFIGCGKMGSAIVSGILKSKSFIQNQISVILPQDSKNIESLKKKFNIEVYVSFPKDKKFDVIIFAVKPQTLDSIINEYKNFITDKDTLILSIAAGKTLNYFSQHFPNNTIIRTMPNINSLVGHGVTVGCSLVNLIESQKQMVESIFSSIGSFTWIEENQIDIIASISACGPAYFYFFTECLFEIAKQLTSDDKLAYHLVTETFIGSAQLLMDSKQPLSSLREAVTSKGGMTEAALEVFKEKGNLTSLIEKALQAANERAKFLSSKIN